MKKLLTKSHLWLGIKYLLISLFVGVVIRGFLLIPVPVTGNSMDQTLTQGDMVLMEKFSKVKRFDVVVFQQPDGTIYIKRVIGLPGDTIEYKNDTLYINGEQSEEPYLTEFKKDLTDNQPLTYDFNLKEVIGSEKVPTGELFVLGDNRRISKDSRIIGLIKEKDIMADVKFVFWPFERFGTID